MKTLVATIRRRLSGNLPARPRPVHGAHGRARDARYVFRAREYPGSRDRDYLVHLPPAYRRGVSLPVVMILHGCDQDHDDIRHVADMDRLADRYGFIVVYPFVTSYPGPRMKNCWAFWLASQIRSGAGEVEDLWQILAAVRRRFGGDPARLHVAGLSSGAGMAIAMLVARCDRIASGAAIAGLPYSESALTVGRRHPTFRPKSRVVDAMNREMGRRKRRVPLLVVQADGDPVVSARAGRRVRDTWTAAFADDSTAARAQQSGTTGGIPWARRRYTDGKGRTVVETLMLEHRGHGWYGGRDGKYGFADGPDVSDAMWRFFADHSLDGATGPAPRRRFGLERIRRWLRGVVDARRRRKR